MAFQEDLFKTSSTVSAFNRSYLLDTSIDDKSIITIIQNDYNQDFVNKRHINIYSPYLYLNNYKFYNIRINNIINNDNNKTNVIFYHITKATIVPKTFSTRL